jgi:cytochrome c556
MTAKLRLFIVAVVLAGVAGLLFTAGPTQAQGEGKDVPATVRKIADMIKAKNHDGAAKTAAAAAKNIEELPDLMSMFRPRNKGGLGIGEKAMANPSKDGIEVFLRDLARDVPGNVAKQAEALETTGFWIAAMGELSIAKAPAKDQGKKTKKAWIGWSTDMREAGIAFAKAAQSKGAQEIKTAAGKVNATCNNCHSVFKE